MVTRPTGATRPSTMALVTVVVPWASEAQASPGRSSARRPSSTPCARLSGTVGTLHERTSPVTSSTEATSVKVPPTSTPTRRRLTPGSSPGGTGGAQELHDVTSPHGLPPPPVMSLAGDH